MAARHHRPPAEASCVQSRLEYFSTHHLFGVLPREVLSDLVAEVTERTYRRGHHLSHAGDLAHDLFVIRSGLVALMEMDERGDAHALLSFAPGDVFGAAAVALGLRRAYSAAAIVETDIYVIHKDTFDRLYGSFPQLAHQVVRELYWMLRRSQQSIVRLTRTPVAARVAGFLLEAASARGDLGTEPFAFELPLSHQDVALLLGTSRETVTRVLIRLARVSLIAVNGRQIVLLKPEALRRVVDG